MRVPFIDLKQRFEEEKDELMACIETVMSAGSLVLTPELDEFETMAASYTGAKHCIGLNSGTDGIMMGLWAAGIGKGDEVIHPPFHLLQQLVLSIMLGQLRYIAMLVKTA